MNSKRSNRLVALVLVPTILLAIVCGETGKDRPVAGAVDPALATLPEIQELFDADELTSEELVRQCLARIEAYDAEGPATGTRSTNLC